MDYMKKTGGECRNRTRHHSGCANHLAIPLLVPLHILSSMLEKQKDGKEILKMTGGVPLQVRNLISFNFSIAKYEKGELCSILFSLGKLHDTKMELEYEGFTTSAVGCILSNTGNALYYDRKYSIPGKGEKFTHYEPLYPLVLVAYQTFFWEDILAYVETHERLLLSVCVSLCQS